VFGDDPRAPRVIETIRKRGYRLVAPVAPAPAESHDTASPAALGIAAAPDARSAVPTGATELAPSRAATGLAGGRRPLRPAMWPAGLAAAVLLGAIAVGFALRSQAGGSAVDRVAGPGEAVRLYPLSGSLSEERDPAVAPDGTRIAFARVSADGERAALQVKLLRSDARQQLTDGAAADRYPTWAPDGTELAFQRIDADGCWIATVPVTGGAVRRLVPCDEHAPPRMAYSPDGRFLVSTRLAEDAPRRWALHRLDLASLELERVTDPRPPYLGDYEPAYSADGDSLVFSRTLPGGAADVWRRDLRTGEERRLTFDFRDVQGQAFAADGSIVFSSDRGGSYALWTLPAAGGDPVWLTGTGSKIKHPSHARSAPVLAFEDWRFQIAVWRLALDGGGAAAGGEPAGEVVARSAGWDFAPAVTPDGRELLFVSSRSGSHELWWAPAEGGEAAQLTRGGGQVLSAARWSPGGARVLYSAFQLGDPDLFVLERDGAVPRRLTADDAVEMMPSWSGDGRFVYYAAERDGRWQVHRLAREGGEASVVADGIAAREAADGSLLVVRPDRRGVWRRRPGSSRFELLVPELEPRDWASWDLAAGGVFYVVGVDDETELRFRSLDGGEARIVGRIGELARPGIAVAPDGRAVFVARVDRADVQLMVAENLGST
jgi:Tol biopolymer transport system component